jgi:acyl dehydratase
MRSNLPAQIEAAPLYFHDLEVGDRLRTSGRPVGEGDIVAFAGLSGETVMESTWRLVLKTRPA